MPTIERQRRRDQRRDRSRLEGDPQFEQRERAVRDAQRELEHVDPELEDFHDTLEGLHLRDRVLETETRGRLAAQAEAQLQHVDRVDPDEDVIERPDGSFELDPSVIETERRRARAAARRERAAALSAHEAAEQERIASELAEDTGVDVDPAAIDVDVETGDVDMPTDLEAELVAADIPGVEAADLDPVEDGFEFERPEPTFATPGHAIAATRQDVETQLERMDAPTVDARTAGAAVAQARADFEPIDPDPMAVMSAPDVDDLVRADPRAADVIADVEQRRRAEAQLAEQLEVDVADVDAVETAPGQFEADLDPDTELMLMAREDPDIDEDEWEWDPELGAFVPVQQRIFDEDGLVQQIVTGPMDPGLREEDIDPDMHIHDVEDIIGPTEPVVFQRETRPEQFLELTHARTHEEIDALEAELADRGPVTTPVESLIEARPGVTTLPGGPVADELIDEHGHLAPAVAEELLPDRDPGPGEQITREMVTDPDAVAAAVPAETARWIEPAGIGLLAADTGRFLGDEARFEAEVRGVGDPQERARLREQRRQEQREGLELFAEDVATEFEAAGLEDPGRTTARLAGAAAGIGIPLTGFGARTPRRTPTRDRPLDRFEVTDDIPDPTLPREATPTRRERLRRLAEEFEIDPRLGAGLAPPRVRRRDPVTRRDPDIDTFRAFDTDIGRLLEPDMRQVGRPEARALPAEAIMAGTIAGTAAVDDAVAAELDPQALAGPEVRADARPRQRQRERAREEARIREMMGLDVDARAFEGIDARQRQRTRQRQRARARARTRPRERMRRRARFPRFDDDEVTIDPEPFDPDIEQAAFETGIATPDEVMAGWDADFGVQATDAETSDLLGMSGDPSSGVEGWGLDGQDGRADDPFGGGPDNWEDL